MKKFDYNLWKVALQKLKDGNRIYLDAETSQGDVSCEMRLKTFQNGQKPFAAVVACSDSRVIPESIFSANLGDLFVIRLAGNVIDEAALGSVEYAVSHLGVCLAVVMGHTHCGAVNAAVNGGAHGYTKAVTDKISSAIGDEKDDKTACLLNVKFGVSRLNQALAAQYNVKTIGAIYHTDSGKVEFLSDDL